MITSFFQSIFGGTDSTISIPAFLICILISLICGVIFALIHSYKSQYSRSFILTLTMLPAVVCVVIMMVNGNIGAGVAVAGAFSLVRFRSLPGSAREITHIFMCMGAGLIAGMGYLAYAILFSVVLAVIELIFLMAGFGVARSGVKKTLRITIPEDLDYTDVFDDLMAKYTSFSEVQSVKTTNMGSLFRLTYHITLKNAAEEKAFIDELRCRNGNLEISISKQEAVNYEL